jgi:hypothetical protein
MNDALKVQRISPLKMMMPVIIFLGLAAIWSIYWYAALGKAKDRLAQIEAAHIQLQCTDRSWGGYPFRIHFDCTGLQTNLQKSDITADKLRLIIQAWNPNHVIGALFGPVEINTTTITGRPIRFSYREGKGKLGLASILAEDQTIKLPGVKPLAIKNINAHMRPKVDTNQLEVDITASEFSLQELRLDSFTIKGTAEPRPPKEGSFSLLSEPSEYLDAIWFIQRVLNLGDAEMNAAQAILEPLLEANDNKLPIQLKDGTWYWGPFALDEQDS